MTFTEAIEQAWAGRRMTRAAWGKPFVYIIGIGGLMMMGMVFSRMTAIPYSPSIDDATATDWEVFNGD